MDLRHSSWLLVILAAAGLPVAASYTNYEVAHVHPLAPFAGGDLLPCPLAQLLRFPRLRSRGHRRSRLFALIRA